MGTIAASHNMLVLELEQLITGQRVPHLGIEITGARGSARRGAAGAHERPPLRAYRAHAERPRLSFTAAGEKIISPYP